MNEPSGWKKLTLENPDHSQWYVDRFRKMEADGEDLAGEARLVDAMAPRQANILDAGCGPGRVGAALHKLGHAVVGVDGDAVLIEAAEADHPGPTWLVSDLSELDLPSVGISQRFDVVVCAGNVLPFLAPSTRGEVLSRLAGHLAHQGRIVAGFAAGRGYEFGDFRDDAVAGGLSIQLELSTWDLRPASTSSDFLVAILGKG